MNSSKSWIETKKHWDARRDVAIADSSAEALDFCYSHFLDTVNLWTALKGHCHIALSGGSTPIALYNRLAKEAKKSVDWKRVSLYWGDERYVPADHPENNAFAAMQAGLELLGIPEKQIHPFDTSIPIEESARRYNELLERELGGMFDLVILGMGDDGHTASLFPRTEGLYEKERSAIANFVPEKSMQRLTITFPCINRSETIGLYVFGKNKAEKVLEALSEPMDIENIPVQAVGTKEKKALWILDRESGSMLYEIRKHS